MTYESKAQKWLSDDRCDSFTDGVVLAFARSLDVFENPPVKIVVDEEMSVRAVLVKESREQLDRLEAKLDSLAEKLAHLG